MDLSKALESIQTIKLRGGIFGKSSLIIIVLTISIASICVVIQNLWVTLSLALPLLGIAFYTIKRCLDFAENNPHAAIMDGAELLIHEQLKWGMKKIGNIERRIENQEIDHPIETVELIDVNKPDLPPPKHPDDKKPRDRKEVKNG